MNQEQRKQYILSIASELEDYFVRYSRAADLEGITNWWLAQSRFKNTPKLIREALNELIDARKIGCRVYQGREIFERINSKEVSN